jgi:diguanylate cyclase (GGDEF)-like protein/PAS domain S-box-containing protein
LEGDEVGPLLADEWIEEAWMTDRTELLEALLDSLPEGVALADVDGHIVYWNQTAEAITGRRNSELVGCAVRRVMEVLVVDGTGAWVAQTSTDSAAVRGSLIHVRHKMGHEFPALVRVLVLRDEMGIRIGLVALFHPAESLDALPHGEIGENSCVGESQSQIEDRLEREFENFGRGETPLGVLWITVDQAHGLRGTHGARACEAMLEKVASTLINGLEPTEEIGRWGDDEFLVLSHERNPIDLSGRAQALAGLARTTDFRWWGDRISLTVSIGAAQAEEGETLARLLERAQAAMQASVHEGGNHATAAPGRHSCLPS